jgi:hypothetical protein
MGLIDATLNIGATAMAGVITQVGLATGDPGAAGTANPTTAPKQSVAWTVPASGDFANNADLNFAGGAPGGPATYITLWQGSTYRGFKVIVGDQAFNAAGQYRIPAGLLVVNGSSTT